MTNSKSKILTVLLPVFLFSSYSISAPSIKPKILKVMIDPGHGGEDQGAAHNEVVEKNITLTISKMLFDYLKNDPNFNPLMTRKSDEAVDLDLRKQKAEELKVDVFISIHANSSPDSNAKGTEIYFESQNPTDEDSLFLANRENFEKKSDNIKNLPEKSDLNNILTDLNRSTHMNLSSLLAQKLLKNFQGELKTRTRAIRQAPFRVLSVSMPASLIELGFISNPVEAKWLNDPNTQKKIAKAIHNALISFKEQLVQVKKMPGGP